MERAFIFVIGLCVGSFLNVLSDRLPRGESVLWGRSHCDWCKKPLRWYELIPVFSYIFLGGKCMRCRKPLSVQYPVIELATGLGFLYLYPQYLLMIVFSALLVLFISDLKYQILPDSMTVVGSVGALLIIVLSPAPVPVLLTHGLAAAASFAFLYVLWAVTRGRGMGFGDVKLAFFMGLFLGFPGIVVAYYIAFLTGAFAGVILILAGKKGWKSKIAFGPFLIAGTILAYLWGPEIIAWWMHIL